MAKKIFLLDGHPDPKSFGAAVAAAYREGAEAGGHELRFAAVRALKFSPNLTHGYRRPKKLEPALVTAQADLRWCEHFVLTTPVWWFGLPAITKGFFDRVFLPDFAFRFQKGTPFWDGLLEGRSARVLYTQGSPQLLIRLTRGDCFWRGLGEGTLEFCGFKPVERTVMGAMDFSSPSKRATWLEDARELGRRGA
jgi:putative NADPH-quinone reductase